MNVLDLAQEINLSPSRVSSTHGGEYKSPCPGCKDGKDRFCIWPNVGTNGRYWCRFCGRRGDAIQFCRDFFGLSYVEACKKVNVQPKLKFNTKKYYPFKKNDFSPSISLPVQGKWREQATRFIKACHRKLLTNQQALCLLEERGITQETINIFCLGWNCNDIFDNRGAWGLPSLVSGEGKEKTQWLPKGIVIPAFNEGSVVQIKIRRSDWSWEDKLPKYCEVSGGLKRPSFYGDITNPIIVLESELDAILIQKFASDLCCCLSLGGVGKRPDQQTHELLKKAPLILLALDYDEAGKKEYPFWMSLYPSLRPWPARKGKSPGDSYKLHQVDLRKWILDGLLYI